MGSIAVVGITGNIGGRVARKLAAAGHDVVGLSRHPGAEAPGRIVAVDLRDADAARKALAGVDGVYLTPPEGGATPLEDERAVGLNVIEAAKEAGVGHVVMHTALQADRGDTGARILNNKTVLETTLADSGTPYTILRPAWYLQNLFGAKPWLDQGMFSMPWAADMAWAATDIEDIASLAAHFFEAGPANRGFDVHLPGGVTAAGIGAAVEAVTGRAVQYQEAPSSRAAVDGYPISDVHKELYAELFDYFRSRTYEGEPTAVTEAVPDFSYGTVEDFVSRELYAAELAHAHR
ncbi:MAG: NAD(P)H-binding protein [Gemmatimonadetes bacterium]|nr:NAD(P)H-binding protein [Gemmatimonadota bacterium]